MSRRFLGPIALLCLSVLLGCSGNFKVPTTGAGISITLSAPSNMTLLPGQTAQFSATVSSASNSGVIWEVDGTVGGNSQVGTITASGLYTAPGAISAKTTVTITAAASADTSATAEAIVTLLAAPIVSISPLNPSVFVNASEQFTASVSNSSNTAVTWQVNGVAGGSASTGTITAAGLYTAPASVPASNPVSITAVSQADTNVSVSTKVIIQPLPPEVTVSPLTATVPGNTTRQFQATVTNTTNTAVTWEVNSIPGGDGTVGTITQTGLYTAPPAIPNPATVTISAVSAANTSSVGSATVTVTTPEVVTVKPPSASANLYATVQFSATSSMANDTFTWQVNGVTGGDATYGTISTSGLYTAPAAAPSNPIVIVKAISGINPSIFGSATVSIGAAVPTVTVTPPNPSVVINTQEQFAATVSPSNLSQAVQWQVDGILGGDSTVGTISTAGLYTAPKLVPNPAQHTISAVSQAVPSIFGTTSVTVTLPNSPISVIVSPPNASPMTTQMVPFTATVSPNNNTDVTWTVSNPALGCTASASNACGSITADPNNSDSASYVAPQTVPGGGSSATVTVTATSVADPTKSGTAMVTVTPLPPPSVTIDSTSLSVCATTSTTCTSRQNPTLTAVAHNFPSGAQLQFNWTLGCINGDQEGTDYCSNSDPGTGDGTFADGDGPGNIQASGGGPTGSTVTNSTSISYLPPDAVYTNAAQSNGCPPASFNGSQSMAYVPITVSTFYNNQTYTSQPTCIEVIY